MRFTLWISRRLRLNGSGSGANATGVVIAVSGIALAVVVMEITLAVVLGFRNQITDRILGFDGQITVLPAYDYSTGATDPYLELTPELDSAIAQVLPGAQPTMRLSQPGIIKTDNDFAGLYFVGYDSTHQYLFERQSVVEGELPDFYNPEDANKIAISASLASSLQLSLGDRPYAYFFVDDAIRSRRFEIAAIYQTGFSDYDKTIVFAPMPTLQRIAHIDSAMGDRIMLDASSMQTIESEAADLQTHLLVHSDEIGNVYPVDNVKHTGAIFFNWLNLLNTNVVVIFILMACVAAFSLITSMLILILDRISTIGLLRALGTSKRQIRQVFTALAMKTALLGVLIGNVVAIPLLELQTRCHVLKLDPDMYYLPYVPIEINWWWFAILNVSVIALSWALLAIPARVASSVSPASTMRFE